MCSPAGGSSGVGVESGLSGGDGRRLGGLEAGGDCATVVPSRELEVGAGVGTDQLTEGALTREGREALGGGAEPEGGRPALRLVVVDASEQGAEHVLARSADRRLARVGGHHDPVAGAAQARLIFGGAGGARRRGNHRAADDGRADAPDHGARATNGHDGRSLRGSGGRGRSELRLRRTDPGLELRDQHADLRSPAHERGCGGAAHPRIDHRDRPPHRGLRPGIRGGTQEPEKTQTKNEFTDHD